VVYEHPGAAPYGVLTGDTLFIGDVGRPDLLTSVGVSADTLARQLYHSTREQLMTLPDETRVFPAHGAGSACGKFLSSETSSTIGDQKRTNYALQTMSEDEFVHAVTEGQSLALLYFAFAASRNKQAREVLHEGELPRAMSLTEVLVEQRRGAGVLDTRDPAAFAQGQLRGSCNVGLSGRYAEYAGDVLTGDQPIVLVCEPGTELEAKTVCRDAKPNGPHLADGLPHDLAECGLCECGLCLTPVPVQQILATSRATCAASRRTGGGLSWWAGARSWWRSGIGSRSSPRSCFS
jgi:hypothetical protein